MIDNIINAIMLTDEIDNRKPNITSNMTQLREAVTQIMDNEQCKEGEFQIYRPSMKNASIAVRIEDTSKTNVFDILVSGEKYLERELLYSALHLPEAPTISSKSKCINNVANAINSNRETGMALIEFVSACNCYLLDTQNDTAEISKYDFYTDTNRVCKALVQNDEVIMEYGDFQVNIDFSYLEMEKDYLMTIKITRTNTVY